MLPETVTESDVAGLVAALGVVVVMCVVAGAIHVTFSVLAAHSRRGGSDTQAAHILSASEEPAALFLAILGLFLSYFRVVQHPHPTFDFANDHDRWALRVWLVTAVAQASHLGSRGDGRHALVSLPSRWYYPARRQTELRRRTLRDSASRGLLNDRILPEVSREP